MIIKTLNKLVIIKDIIDVTILQSLEVVVTAAAAVVLILIVVKVVMAAIVLMIKIINMEIFIF